VSTQFGLTIKAVQCDNGREFDNSTSHAFFLSHGVQLRMSCPYTSSQNGKAERMIRTTNDTVRTLLLQALLPARLWAESLHTSTYLINRLPFAACPAPIPHHALFGTPLATITFKSLGVHVTQTPPPPLLTSWLPVRLSVSSLGTLRITRGTDATTLPLVASSSLAMWCSMSLSFPFPPLPLPLPLRSLTSPLCFLLTRWSSHLYRCFL